MEERRRLESFDDLPRSLSEEFFGEARAIPYVHVKTLPSLSLLRKEDLSLLFLYGVPLATLHHSEGNVVEKVLYKVSDETLKKVRGGGELLVLAGVHFGITPKGFANLPFESSKVSPLRALFAQKRAEVMEYLSFRSSFLKGIYGGEGLNAGQVQRQVELLQSLIKTNAVSLAKSIVGLITAKVVSEDGEELLILKRGLNRPSKPYERGKGMLIGLWINPQGEKFPVYPRTPLSRAVAQVVDYYLGKADFPQLHAQFNHLVRGREEREEFFKSQVLRYVADRREALKELKGLSLEAFSSAAVLSFLYYEEFSKLIEESIRGQEEAVVEVGEEEEVFLEGEIDFTANLQKAALERLKEESFELEL